MKWLGINVPNYLEEDLKEAGDILQESVKLSRDIFEELYKYGQKKEFQLVVILKVSQLEKQKLKLLLNFLMK